MVDFVFIYGDFEMKFILKWVDISDVLVIQCVIIEVILLVVFFELLCGLCG